MQAGLEAHHVTVFVYDRNVAGVAVLVRGAIGDHPQRTFNQGCVARELLRRSWTQLKRCFAGIDELTALARVVLREEALVWNLDEIHVAEEFFAISHCQLDGLRTDVKKIGAVVAERLELVSLTQVRVDQLCGTLAR